MKAGALAATTVHDQEIAPIAVLEVEGPWALGHILGPQHLPHLVSCEEKAPFSEPLQLESSCYILKVFPAEIAGTSSGVRGAYSAVHG